MTRIFDNIEQDLLATLRGTMQVSTRADFCVRYLNLCGWQAVDDLVQPWKPENGQVCRELYRQSEDGFLIDNATASWTSLSTTTLSTECANQWKAKMLDLSPAQSADRITSLVAAHESPTPDFKRISGKLGRISLRDASQVKGSIWD